MIRPRLDSHALDKKGIAICQTGETRISSYIGSRFDSNLTPFIPYKADNIEALWSYCTSKQYTENIKKITPGYIKQIQHY
jgi:hypothetical protein